MLPILRLLATILISLQFAWAASPSPAAENGKTSVQTPVDGVPLVVFNRTVFVFRGEFLGVPAATRARRAQETLTDRIQKGGDLAVAIKDNPEGKLVILGGTAIFIVTPGDVDPLLHQDIDEVSRQAGQRLEQVIGETREARSIETILKALGIAAAATAIYVALLSGIGRLRAWLVAGFMERAAHKAARLNVGGTQLIETGHLYPILLRLLNAIRWLIVGLLTYEWISFVLSRFPYTRPWGERLNDYLLGVAEALVSGIVGAIPGLGVAAVIFVLARFSTNFVSRLLERLAQGQAGIGWLAPDTMPTTRRLVGTGIWLFAIAMAYPYLPGAQTEAFRGLSVLLGLMISLGASSVVGQSAAGLILTYTRTIRPSEYVKIGEHEGTVVGMGMFATTIRTGLGEELSIPNSLITGSVTKNYSRAVSGQGYVVDTTVTIGYDTPWRQVEAMLIEAAHATPGILKTPAPRVFQTALSDYYPEYRLFAQAVPGEPRARAEILSTLHANIQDVFNRYGVQIMSPHYIDDGSEPKVVKPENWYPAPVAAEKPADSHRS